MTFRAITTVQIYTLNVLNAVNKVPYSSSLIYVTTLYIYCQTYWLVDITKHTRITLYACVIFLFCQTQTLYHNMFVPYSMNANDNNLESYYTIISTPTLRLPI